MAPSKTGTAVDTGSSHFVSASSSCRWFYIFTQPVTVERRARDAAQFPAKLADLGAPVFHRGLGETDLRLGEPELPAAKAAAGARRLQPCHGALANQAPLERRRGREAPEDQLATRGRGVDGGALASQDLEADAARGKVLGGIDEVLKMRAYPMRIGCPLYGRL